MMKLFIYIIFLNQYFSFSYTSRYFIIKFRGIEKIKTISYRCHNKVISPFSSKKFPNSKIIPLSSLELCALLFYTTRTSDQ